MHDRKAIGRSRVARRPRRCARFRLGPHLRVVPPDAGPRRTKDTPGKPRVSGVVPTSATSVVPVSEHASRLQSSSVRAIQPA